MIRHGLKRPGIRLLSSPSISYNDYVAPTAQTSPNSVASESRTNASKASHLPSHIQLAALPSTVCVDSLSRGHFTSSVESELKVKHELYEVLGTKRHALLLEVIHRLTKQGVWQMYLTPTELGFFISKLVEGQIDSIVGLARLKNLKKYVPKADLTVKEDETKRYRDQIREIYSHLVYKSKQLILLSIYDKRVRKDFYKADTTGYQLLMTDYENLVMLEYGNNKFDLARKWFERYYQQGFTDEDMSWKLWQYRFKLAGADPRLWEEFLNDIYRGKYKVARSVYTKEPFSQVLNSFLKYNKASDHLACIIYGLGYEKDVGSIEKILAEEYGIVKDGSETVSFIRQGTAKAPDLNVIQAIIVSLSYNKRYFDVMKIVNLLQSDFEVEISHMDYKPIWEALIKWGDLTSRFSKKLALRYFIKHHNPKVVANSNDFQEVLKDVNFDYERYLQYFDQLKATRNNVMKQIFSLYHQDQQHITEQKFSLKNYISYQSFVKQLDDESELYKYLTYLSQYFHLSNVSTQSFNYIHMPLNGQAYSIYNLYYSTMVTFIKSKVERQLLGQVKYLIDEWSLNEEMKTQLNSYYSHNLKKFVSDIEAKRKQEMVRQRSEEEEDEKFLDLI